jgi:hypothetical protein
VQATQYQCLPSPTLWFVRQHPPCLFPLGVCLYGN